jgi:hypothetical protein
MKIINRIASIKITEWIGVEIDNEYWIFKTLKFDKIYADGTVEHYAFNHRSMDYERIE